MPDVSPVLLEVADGVATVTFNRPDAMNSLDVATKEALLDALHRVAGDPAARCVVLTGTGRAFCVGQDLKEHVQLLQSGATDTLFATVE
jgi:2-(1,2-epoxy-1,2-dihydrophenyl)acetyl-CoA isomerase